MVEKLCFGIVAASLAAAAAWAEVTAPTAIVTPKQPQWTELTVEQKWILAPLSDEWDIMEAPRQKKWLGVTRRFLAMTPEEQRRVQAQMHAWGKLTPDERRLARENFVSASKLPPEKKQDLRQKWEEYSNLPEVEKARLKQQASTGKLPLESKQGASRTTTAGTQQVPPAAARPASPAAEPAAASAPPADTSAGEKAATASTAYPPANTAESRN